MDTVQVTEGAAGSPSTSCTRLAILERHPQPRQGSTMTFEPIRVESPFGMTVERRLHLHDPRSERLMLILPGRAYLVSHPVLFHMAQMAYQQGWDVLPVQYGYQLGGELRPEQEPLLAEDVRLATAPVLQRGYREVCVVGKSLGTPLAMDVARTAPAEAVSRILLTPVGPALAPADGIRTLAIIGTHDPLHAPGLATDTASTTWRVFDRLDHGLVDEDDWRYSVESLAAIEPPIASTSDLVMARPRPLPPAARERDGSAR
jgi:hypothetical protein